MGSHRVFCGNCGGKTRLTRSAKRRVCSNCNRFLKDSDVVLKKIRFAVPRFVGLRRLVKDSVR